MSVDTLNTYINLCRSDPKPIFLLRDDFAVQWCNDAAQGLCYPADYWRNVFLADGMMEKIEYQVNKNRFFVLDRTEDEKVILITRIDQPTRYQFFELSLWPSSPVIELAVLENTNYLSDNPPPSSTAVLNYKWFDEIFCCANKLLGLIGIQVSENVAHFSNSILTRMTPEAFTEFIGILLSYICMHSIPGTLINVKIDLENGRLIIRFAKSSSLSTYDESLAPVFDLYDRYIAALVEKIHHWTGMELSETEAVIPVNIIDHRVESPFSHPSILLNCFSKQIGMEKLSPFFERNDLVGRWPEYSKPWGTVSQSIDLIGKRLKQFDYRNLYSPQYARNGYALHDLCDVDQTELIRFTGISGKDCGAIRDGQRHDTALAERYAAFYGLSTKELETPQLIPQFIMGDIALETPAGMIAAEYLVLQTLCSRGFQTENAAFHACKNAVRANGGESENHLEIAKRLIIKRYLDQSVPVPEKIGNNLTLLRLHANLPLEEAARLAGVSGAKLAELERGDVSNTYCRELDRLCELYGEMHPFGLFINGYVLNRLWRKNFIEFVTIGDEKNAASLSNKEIKKLGMNLFFSFPAPMAIINEIQQVVCCNKAYKDLKTVPKAEMSYQDLCYMRMVIWRGDNPYILLPLGAQAGTIHLFELPKRNVLAVMNTNDPTFDLTEIRQRVKEQRWIRASR